MVLTSGDIKTIATEIASKIITELRRPVEKSFSENEPVGVREATYNDKDTLISSFKDHERHTPQRDRKRKNAGLNISK